MSHITEIEVQVNDLEALGKACQEIGVKLVLNQKSFRWFGSRKQACDHAITIEGSRDCYEIGVVQDNGAYKLQWDEYAGGRGMVAKVGSSAMKLRDHYGAQVAKSQLTKQGYRVMQSLGTNGQIVLRAF